MSEHPTPEQRLRCVALEAVSRCVPPEGQSTNGLLSRARQAETYLATGLSQTGPRFQQGTQVGAEGLSVLVDGEDLTTDLADRLRAAVAGVLTPTGSVPAAPSAVFDAHCPQCGKPFMSKDCDHPQRARGVAR